MGLDSTQDYACRFASMINGWRDEGGLGDYGFVYAQLAPYFSQGRIHTIREA